MPTVTKPIILASGSPRRKELLEQIGLTFTVEPSQYQENMQMDLPPLELAKKLASGKANDIAEKHHHHIVIGADTLIAFQGKVLGKPKNDDHAFQILSGFSGTHHTVITGYTIIDTSNGHTSTKAIETRVYFRNLTENEIHSYIATTEPYDKAGAYAIQGLGALLIEKIEGEYSNVIGLPLSALAQSLRKHGISLF